MAELLRRACGGDGEALQSTASLCTEILAQAAQASAAGGVDVEGDIVKAPAAGAITFATIERTSGCLLLGRLDAGGVYVVALPVATEMSALLASWHAASARGKALLQRTSDPSRVSAWTESEKRDWWGRRQEADDDIADALDRLQDLLGPWRCLLSTDGTSSVTGVNLRGVSSKGRVLGGLESVCGKAFVEASQDVRDGAAMLESWTGLLTRACSSSGSSSPLSAAEARGVMQQMVSSFWPQMDEKDCAAVAGAALGLGEQICVKRESAFSSQSQSKLQASSLVSFGLSPAKEGQEEECEFEGEKEEKEEQSSPSPSLSPNKNKNKDEDIGIDSLCDSLTGLKVTDLKSRLKAAGLKTDGLKGELLVRLQTFEKENNKTLKVDVMPVMPVIPIMAISTGSGTLSSKSPQRELKEVKSTPPKSVMKSAMKVKPVPSVQSALKLKSSRAPSTAIKTMEGLGGPSLGKTPLKSVMKSSMKLKTQAQASVSKAKINPNTSSKMKLSTISTNNNKTPGKASKKTLFVFEDEPSDIFPCNSNSSELSPRPTKAKSGGTSSKNKYNNNNSSKNRPAPTLGGGHALLVLDEALQVLPWESLPCLLPKDSSRLPGLALLLAMGHASYLADTDDGEDVLYKDCLQPYAVAAQDYEDAKALASQAQTAQTVSAARGTGGTGAGKENQHGNRSPQRSLKAEGLKSLSLSPKRDRTAKKEQSKLPEKSKSNKSKNKYLSERGPTIKTATVSLARCWYSVDPEANLPNTRATMGDFLLPYGERYQWRGYRGEMPPEGAVQTYVIIVFT